MTFKDLDYIISIFNLTGDAKITLLLVGAMALLGWWSYTKSQSDSEKRIQGIRAEYDEIYAPAYGMIISHRSGLLDEEMFKEKFRDLLIEHRSKSTDKILIQEMNEWLSGNGDIDWLQVRFEEKCAACEKKLLIDGGDKILAAFVWAFKTVAIVAFFGSIMPVVLGSSYYIIKSVQPYVWSVVLSAIPVGILAGIMAGIYYKVKRSKLKRRKREVKRHYAGKDLQRWSKTTQV